MSKLKSLVLFISTFLPKSIDGTEIRRLVEKKWIHKLKTDIQTEKLLDLYGSVLIDRLSNNKYLLALWLGVRWNTWDKEFNYLLRLSISSKFND